VAEWPREERAAIRGVMTDIDDTLTREGRIEPAALAALHALAAAGLPVIAITGRPAGWSEPFALAWPVAAVVAENGAVALINERGRLRHAFVQDEPRGSATSPTCNAWPRRWCARCPARRWQTTAPAA
jgi:predicted mannosyl-3-phosphoglycerate phosphatase (HAD superfamily)